MAEKVKSVALDETHRIQSLTKDAARSGAYLYPLRGIFYFATHRSLWAPLIQNAIPLASLAASITVPLFLFTYLPQMAIMAFTSGPLAPFSAFLACCTEAATLTNIAAKSFLLGDALVDTFDATMMARGQENLVAQGREIKKGKGDAIWKLGKLVKRPFAAWSPNAIFRYLVTLPLNLIPVVGTVMWVALRGKGEGPSALSRYFQLKGWGAREKEEHIKARRGAYTSFGVVAVLLEMVPAVNIVFAFTNTVGAALFAADMEKGSSEQGSSESGRELRSGDKKAQ